MGREERFASTGFVPPHACLGCYTSVAACYLLVFRVPLDPRPWRNGLYASILATLVTFGFALAYRNTSVYDPFWVFYPVFTAFGWMASTGVVPSVRACYTFGLLLLWFARFNYQWTWEGWTVGIRTEDWRYVRLARLLKLRDSTGAMYWVVVSFLASMLTPTLLVWLVLAPVQEVWCTKSVGSRLGALDAFAAATSAGGVLLQFVSDRTLFRFRERNIRNVGQAPLETQVCSKTCREGPWAYSRHPNYLGEVMFWLGMDLAAVAADWEGRAWPFGGSLVFLCFFRVSAAFMDRRSLENRPGYAGVMEEVSALVPCPLVLDRFLDRLLVGVHEA